MWSDLAHFALCAMTEEAAGRAHLCIVWSERVVEPAVFLRLGARLGLDRGVGAGEGRIRRYAMAVS